MQFTEWPQDGAVSSATLDSNIMSLTGSAKTVNMSAVLCPYSIMCPVKDSRERKGKDIRGKILNDSVVIQGWPTLAFDCKTTHVPSLSHITLAHDQTAVSPNVQLSLCRRVETNEWAEDRRKVPRQLLPQMLVLLALPSSSYFYSAPYSLWESEVSNYLKAPNFLN